MLRLTLKISALCLAFAMGRCSAPVKTETVEKIVKVPGPVQLIYPVANRGVELQDGMTWVNPDAEVPIIMVSNEARLLAALDYNPDAGFLMGAYKPSNPSIYILGTWTMECETIIHEYTHMLESAMPDQAWRIRAVFHKLCSDKFRIDSVDLLPVLEQPGEQK